MVAEFELRIVQAKTERICAYCAEPIPAGSDACRVEGGLAHVACKERRWSLLPSAAVAEKLGLTPAQFLKLARQLVLEPESSYPNPHYRSGPEVPLWPPELADTLAAHPDLLALKARSQAARTARQRKAEQRQTTLAERYPSWQDALPDAAEAMFNLNRYAKWKNCASAHRQEIYTLKNAFVRLLYHSGYAVEVRRHAVPRAGLICWGCDGYGCERCDDTGFYRRPDELVYVAFRFRIGERLFSWHQPERLVDWPVAYTAKGEVWNHDPDEEKPVELKPREFADAKALVRFVLKQTGR